MTSTEGGKARRIGKHHPMNISLFVISKITGNAKKKKKGFARYQVVRLFVLKTTFYRKKHFPKPKENMYSVKNCINMSVIQSNP